MGLSHPSTGPDIAGRDETDLEFILDAGTPYFTATHSFMMESFDRQFPCERYLGQVHIMCVAEGVR